MSMFPPAEHRTVVRSGSTLRLLSGIDLEGGAATYCGVRVDAIGEEHVALDVSWPPDNGIVEIKAGDPLLLPIGQGTEIRYVNSTTANGGSATIEVSPWSDADEVAW